MTQALEPSPTEPVQQAAAELPEPAQSPPQTQWQFSFTTTAAELRSVSALAGKSQNHPTLAPLTKSGVDLIAATVLVVLCLFSFGFGIGTITDGVWLGAPLLGAIIAALVLGGWVLYAELVARNLRVFSAIAVQPQVMTLSAQGVSQTSLGNVSSCTWPSVAHVQVTGDFLLLVRPASAFYLPLRCIENAAQQAALVTAIAQWQAAQPYQAPSAPPPLPMTLQRRSQFVVALALCLAFATQGWWTQPLWLALYEPVAEQVDAAQTEARARVNPADEAFIYGEHQAVLQTALDAIALGTPGKPELYAVVLGGDASERVFAREVAAISARLKGTAHSTTALLNSRADSTSLPLATVTALKAVLDTIGERMNKDEDMLLLYLSSHGSKPADGHELLLNHPPLQLQQITPAALREALDAAGISHRVVIVSACYAGGYLEPLKSDSSIVLTASRADRTSFGCGDDSLWTYFGQALWQDQRFLVSDIRSVFETAKLSIAKKEKAQDFEPSEPQASFGAAAEARWRSLFAKPSETPK